MASIKNHLLGLIVLIAIAFFVIANLLADLYWFESLGFESVFFIAIFSRIFLFLELAVGFFAIFLLMFLLARKTLLKQQKISKKFFQFYAFISIAFAYMFSANWLTVLRYFNFEKFNILDPVFSQDISFYVFELPFYNFVLGFVFTAVLISFLALLILRISQIKPKLRHVQVDEQMFTRKEWDVFGELKKLKEIKPFFFVSAAVFLFLFATVVCLQRFSLLFSDNGAVFGATYVDVNIFLPVMNIFIGLAVIVGIFFLLLTKLEKTQYAFGGLILLFIVAVFGLFAAGIVQALQVEPDELNFEKPFIERNIEFTNKAYGLNEIQEKAFDLSFDLTAEDLHENREILDNIRVWDWRPLKQTFSQLQLFRTYYDFLDVDVDRYNLQGVNRQLMLSAREISTQELSQEAKTWINEHLVYTHGYGIVAVPVNAISEEGLPKLFLKDLPPKTSFPDLKIAQPEIYYGEKTTNFVITNTKTGEFDYPAGEQNVYTSYKGSGGVQFDSFFKKLIYAIKFFSIPLLFSASITNESKILFNRDIYSRLETLTPFLAFDSDPYIVIADEKLYWIIDGYTLTDSYPYSKPFNGGNFNYIRNSVKVVIDAYNGSMQYYVMEDEPLISTYRKIFPALFKDFSEMPSSLKKHIRYPEDLFHVQAVMYGTYHMKNPQVFYNKEDVWVIPNELYHASKQKVEPYYIITKIAGEQKEGFMLIMPFVPRGKENMIGWLAAKSDPAEYGEKTIFKFSKQELVYGPMQIESRIDQDPDISQIFTLWGQQGSEIIRGNLLIIPIKDSVLYIEPVYLQATAQGSIPELKRVIVVYNDLVVMEETLEKALGKIFGTVEKKSTIQIEGVQITPITAEEAEALTQKQLISKANSLYKEAQNALKEGNFSLYAEKIEELGKVLGQLEASG